LFIFIIATSFPQTVDERLLLIENQKMLTYLDNFEQIDLERAGEYAVASNVAHSITRTINVVMNAYHLIHIYSIIQGKEDRATVLDYLKEQLPHTRRLLEIELKLTSKFITASEDKVIKNNTDMYMNSLEFVLKTLNNFS
jgi:hypothetical protein